MAEWVRIACDRELLKDDPTWEWVTPGHPLDEVDDLLWGKVEGWTCDRARYSKIGPANNNIVMSRNKENTRKEFIDKAPQTAGWNLEDPNQVGIEIPVDGYDILRSLLSTVSLMLIKFGF